MHHAHTPQVCSMVISSDWSDNGYQISGRIGIVEISQDNEFRYKLIKDFSSLFCQIFGVYVIFSLSNVLHFKK